MLVIGITGGIGSGKSLVADFFCRRGAAILDADEISRELMQAGSPLLAELAEEFGQGVLRPDGSLDRRELARCVFGDREAVAKLNAITHPAIMGEIASRLRSLRAGGAKGIVCLVVPLLLEVQGRGLVDRVLVVTADEDERVRRVMARDGLTEPEVRRRMAAQMSPQEQARAADWVVDTTAGREAATRQLEEIWAELNG